MSGAQTFVIVGASLAGAHERRRMIRAPRAGADGELTDPDVPLEAPSAA
jgi:hypothetical protein